MKNEIKYIANRIQRQDSVIKGRIAECLVKELFEMMGVTVYPFGIEHQLPELASKYKNGKLEQGIALKHLANQPDFVISDERDGTVTLHRIEVKFRGSGAIRHEELEKYDEDIVFIFLDKRTLFVASKECLDSMDTANIKFSELSPLSSGAIFELTRYQKKLVYEFSELVSKYLGDGLFKENTPNSDKKSLLSWFKKAS